jgi:hypothetical protein
MRRRYKLLVVAVLLVILAVAVASPHPRLVPVREGTSKDFWSAATGVRTKGVLGGPSSCLPEPVDGWYLYASQHMHGSDFYRVPQAEVLAEFPKGVDELGGDAMIVPEWSAEGFASWEKADPERGDVNQLLQHLRMARLQWRLKNHPEFLRYLQDDFNLGVAFQRMSQFRLMQLAEWAYLSALIVFAAWPWLRGGGRWAWAVHTALIPPLLLLPYFLGYCAWIWTSAGPCGGVVYPFVLDELRPLPWTSLDSRLIRHVPQVLDSLTGPLGPMLSLSGGRHAGPVAAISLGLVLGAAVFAIGSAWRRRGKTRPGVPLPGVAAPDDSPRVVTASPSQTA